MRTNEEKLRRCRSVQLESLEGRSLPSVPAPTVEVGPGSAHAAFGLATAAAYVIR